MNFFSDMTRKILLILFLSLFVLFSAAADLSFNSILLDYHRIISLTDSSFNYSLNYHSCSTDLGFDRIKYGPWRGEKIKSNLLQGKAASVSIVNPENWVSWNSATAWGYNDGSIWQGKGFNSIVSGGIEVDTPNVVIKFVPEFWIAQNSYIDTIDTTSSSGYGDYWTVFDNLQRYGDSAYSDFSYGSSELRFFFNDLTLGISNEAVILGPGRKNNIIMSNNAGGFPHIDFGTLKKVKLGNFGVGEFKGLWGILKESEFFDDDPTDDYGWISGSYIAVSPNIIPNFTLGFNYQYYKPLSGWDGWDLIRLIPFLDRSNSPTDLKDMMISVPFMWIFPEIGFEFYGEWARNDNFSDLEDLFQSPEHTQAYTLGVMQVLKKWTDNVVVLSLELSTLAQERTYEVRAAGPWYRHGWSGWTQGYTYNGQLLGASIGPGSDSQWMDVSWYYPSGKSSVFMQRVAHDKDYYYTLSSKVFDGFFVEFDMGIENTIFMKNLDLNTRLIYTYIYNNNFEENNNIINFHIECGLRYKY